MRERDLQAKVVGYARAKGCLARKLDFGQGWPDVMFLYDSRTLFVEFKGANGRLEPLQGHMHKLIREHGFDVLLVKDPDVGQYAIDAFIKGVRLGYPVIDYAGTTKEIE